MGIVEQQAGGNKRFFGHGLIRKTHKCAVTKSEQSCAEAVLELTELTTDHGLTIPKACGISICGTCRVRVLEGETEMNHNGGITEEEVAEGYVLSCCTKAKSDVSVEY